MSTFNNDPSLKADLIRQLKHHQELDAFVRGKWLTGDTISGNGRRGCFYGCTMQTEHNPREAFSEKYHMDLMYVYLTERIFEGLPDNEYKTYPVRSIECVPVGFDFNKIKSPFFHALLMDKEHGVINFYNGNKPAEAAIRQVAELFTVDFDKIDKKAAWDAAYSARTAAEAAAEAAEWAVRAAAMAARAADNQPAHYTWMANLLVELIEKNK